MITNQLREYAECDSICMTQHNAREILFEFYWRMPNNQTYRYNIAVTQQQWPELDDELYLLCLAQTAKNAFKRLET
jgi:hypothetical protein